MSWSLLILCVDWSEHNIYAKHLLAQASIEVDVLDTDCTMLNHLAKPEQDLIDLIRSQEKKVLGSFPFEARLAIIELARSTDYMLVRQMSLAGQTQAKEESEAVQFISFGVNKAHTLFLDDSCKNPGAPLFQSTPELNTWADSVLQHCGRLGYCEQLLEICRLGLGELLRINAHEYHFRAVGDVVGVEYYEREYFNWARNAVVSSQKLNVDLQATKRAYIRKSMSERVSPWMIHYIQYETTPEIDGFYEVEGRLQAQRMVGPDSFPNNVQFGGLHFGLYCDAVTTLIGWSLKHLDFCVELLNKHPELNPRNIATVTVPLERISKELTHALNIDERSAEQLVQVLTLSIDNKETHCLVPGDIAAPPFIEIGDKELLFPLWGNLTHPFIFMLDELKRRYRFDWDRAVDNREAAFRAELFSLFTGERFFKVDRNIKLRSSGLVMTDIDGLIFDRATGVVAIFQLKWQDFFGGSMRERESRKANILRTGNLWIDRVFTWLGSRSTNEIAEAIGINRNDVSLISKFKLFMIGRNFAHFSGHSNPDPRAAWGLWYQVLKLMKESANSSNPIESLFDMLKQDSPLKKERPEIEKQEIYIGDAKIILQPE